MPRPSYKWIIADTHWFHDAICRDDFESRPTDHMEQLIDNCRKVIAPQDELIHLGDVIFYKADMLAELLDLIHCSCKTLVMGNHDKKSRHWYMSNGFDFVCDMFTLDDVIFTHRPLETVPAIHVVGQMPRPMLNVHGHWHGWLKRGDGIPDWYNLRRHYLVSLETNGYKPERLDLVRAQWQTLLNTP